MSARHPVTRTRLPRRLTATFAVLAASALLLVAPAGATAGGDLFGKLSRASGSELSVELQHTYDGPIENLALELNQPGFQLGGSLLVVPSRVPARCDIGSVLGTPSIACAFGPPGYFPPNTTITILGATTTPRYPDSGAATANACLQPCTGPPSSVGPFNIPGPGDVLANPQLSGKKKQKLGKNVKVNVSCEQSCEATGSGRIVVTGIRPGLASGASRSTAEAAKKTKSKLKKQTKQIGAGESATLKLGVSKKGRKTGKKALKQGGKAKAKVKVTVTGPAGDSSTEKQTIKLKRKG